jgi:hypothetical protein
MFSGALLAIISRRFRCESIRITKGIEEEKRNPEKIVHISHQEISMSRHEFSTIGELHAAVKANHHTQTF